MAFSKVLIANRGEIAVRIIRACRKLGQRSVAVFSDADENAPYVRQADEAVHIGAPEARASYLNAERIIAAAQQTGSDAIHPGYGFLAENPAFARRCAESGLVFVGPSPEAIEAMGGKIAAKRIAAGAGVACVPGYQGEDQSDATLLREAQRIGAPLLIKASAGGGGRGMRRVGHLGSFARDVALARQESSAAFGNPTLLLERYIESARHIEVQILGDRHGNVRHLFERDCSIQRNYQKIIEEAPAPNLPAALRESILVDAVKLARTIGYDNAGTLEFVVDERDGRAYFLEMNTRLQVEHPVTEMVTGIDIVEWQLRIAAGEAIAFAQEDVFCRGSAIEVRIAAENPAAGYRAETGTVSAYAEPRLPGIRIDSGIEAGSTVTPYYDSMLAKLIAAAPDRSTAISLLRSALADFRIAGLTINTAFLRDVLDLAEFRAGEHVTHTLRHAFPEGWSFPAVNKLEMAAAVLAKHLARLPSPHDAPWSSLGAWRLGEAGGHGGAAYYVLRGAGKDLGTARLEGRMGAYRVERDGELLLEVRGARLAGDALSFLADGLRVCTAVAIDGPRVQVQSGAAAAVLEVLQAEEVFLGQPRAQAGGGNSVLAPTPGLVGELLVGVGDMVEQGQAVLVFEAMKLLQQLCAPIAGRVEAVCCQPGSVVSAGDCLITIQRAQSEETAP